MERDVYILSCRENGGIYHYRFADGVLSFLEKRTLDRPMYAVVDDHKLHVLLRAPFSDNRQSGLVTIALEDGKLGRQSPVLPTKGQVACHLCVCDGQIYVANYISGSVIKMPDVLVEHRGSSVHETRQLSAHAHYINVSPDAEFLCVADLGMDKVLIYDKELRMVSQIDALPGSGPRHLACSSDGSYVYCANELASTVSVYRWNHGTLLPLGTYSTLPEGYDGISTVAAIRCDGDRVYVSNRGHDTIACFRAEQEKLLLTGMIDCHGRSPRDFQILGDYLICANEKSNNVTVFRKQTGEKIGEVEIPEPLCVCF